MAKDLKTGNGKQSENREIAALLVGLIAEKQLFSCPNGIETGWNFRKAMQYLQDNWSIVHTTSAINTLEYIKYEGERTAYNILLPSFLDANDKNGRRELLGKKFLSLERLEQYSDNLSDCLNPLKENKAVSINATDLQKGILAWDMVQIILIARKSYDAYYFTEKETWKNILFAYSNCLKVFNCWEEVWKSYIIGEAMCNGNNPNFNRSLDLLAETLIEEDLFWRKIKFK